MKKIIIFGIITLLSSTLYSQITGISNEQKIVLVTALNNYEFLKHENKLLKKEVGFSEMQLQLKQREIDQLNKLTANQDTIITSQKTIISNHKKLIKQRKKNGIRNNIVAVSLGVLIGVLITK